MALRSLSRAGVEVGGRVAGKRATHAARHVVLGAERKMSSFVGEGHGQGQFGRSQAPSYRQGTLSSGTQLFKLVETDLMSKELTRYGPSDAEHLGLHSIEDVLADIAAATPPQEPAAPIATAIVPSVVTVSSDAQEDPVAAVAAAAAAPAAREAEVLAAWGLEPVVTDAPEVEVDGVEAPTAGKVDKVEEEGVSQEKMAIKRTYQPSTLKRKRKHGFLYRVKTRLGKKILQRRQDKGRWRLGI